MLTADQASAAGRPSQPVLSATATAASCDGAPRLVGTPRTWLWTVASDTTQARLRLLAPASEQIIFEDEPCADGFDWPGM